MSIKNNFFIKDGKRVKKYDIQLGANGEEVVRPTEAWKQEKQEIEFIRRMESSSIPTHALSLTLNDYIGKDKDGNIPKARDFINRFEERHKSTNLYIWSEQNGTQKSTVASILGREIVRKGFKVEFILMSSLVNILKEADFNESIKDTVQRCLKADLLIIDDSFDRGKMTVYKSGYQLPFLDTFLRQRLEQERKSTIITSNISIDQLQGDFNASIHSLVKRSFYEMHFQDSYLLKDDFNPEDLWS